MFGNKNLIVEREAPLGGHARRLELDDAAGRAHEDHLAVVLVEEDDAVTPHHAVAEQCGRDLQVREAHQSLHLSG